MRLDDTHWRQPTLPLRLVGPGHTLPPRLLIQPFRCLPQLQVLPVSEQLLEAPQSLTGEHDLNFVSWDNCMDELSRSTPSLIHEHSS